MPDTPSPSLLMPPTEGKFKTFDDLITTVQCTAKEQGYGIVKLRASNYRNGKPTRYDLVCDRGGVKYKSTARKRSPSTRKVDCPFRAKAVCEVQLGNQWRFTVQEQRHNHEPRVPADSHGQEDSSLATSIQSLINKLGQLNQDTTQGLMCVEQHLDTFQKRLQSLEAQVGDCALRLQVIEGGRMGGGEMDDAGSCLLASAVL
ncbi:hypothetical protein FSARC_9624 [Fusarium sarcochroum]|uniref:FAR1 domain-containing protein n=1 Tax=Fusarium sarcochroum TaxID=1208366 RepID=A0A8H4TQI9_9HYPO|nr:hypothetical protein FSARC_9624 [Fusarium sarcochroum]